MRMLAVGGRSTISLNLSRNLYKAALKVKRALDEQSPLDFVNLVRVSKTLFVGEGNLSFAVELTRKAKEYTHNIIATTYLKEADFDELTAKNARVLREKHVEIRGGVDARNLERWFSRAEFDFIVFQFPNVGSRKPRYGRNANHILVRHFLRSARQRISLKGCVAITVVNSPHYDGAFHMDEAAQRYNFHRPVAHPFNFEEFPGYIHAKTKDDGESAIRDDSTFVTYVFRPKLGKMRSWTIVR